MQLPGQWGWSAQSWCESSAVWRPWCVLVFPSLSLVIDLLNALCWPLSISFILWFSQGSVQFTQSCPTLCNPMNRSTAGLPVHHQLLEFTQTHVHRVRDAIQPSHPLSSPSLPALNPSQHQGLCQWVSSSHQVAKVFEFQLQHQSFQWTLKVAT